MTINSRPLANVSFLIAATAVSFVASRSNNFPEFRVIHHGKLIAWSTRVSKRFVYVLKNDESPSKYYTGLTDVTRRCAEHNAGSCTHTAKHRPWSVDVVIEFADERRAVAFERYLNAGPVLRSPIGICDSSFGLTAALDALNTVILASSFRTAGTSSLP